MKYSKTVLLISAFLLTFCKNKSDSPLVDAPNIDVEGTYVGYRSQQQGQRVAADSTEITLQVTRISANQVQILQTSPNEFRYTVTTNSRQFTYDRGIIEAPCGVASIKGEGSFNENSLYLEETLKCTKNTTIPDSFIRLRATKK
ncbi:hypothetical protein [Persicitalea jodogahamensis]|uniref:Uncharacterized protein n=1 Tax=Persicitalea jodogahamensis TaxID=402147 RepID=A0A8J3GBW4_9BACT|nr:hypothetical protein [Persicitalea jodogahamensis]GHB80589.1 hypothetical protein GCM10007390_38710 [Persicitalea jodogahamensis]